MSKKAADKVFAKSGYSPSDVQVVELHDCFSANELISYEALGLCPPGKQQRHVFLLNVHACKHVYTGCIFLSIYMCICLVLRVQKKKN